MAKIAIFYLEYPSTARLLDLKDHLRDKVLLKRLS